MLASFPAREAKLLCFLGVDNHRCNLCMYAKPSLSFACLLMMDFDLVHCPLLPDSEAEHVPRCFGYMYF